MATGMVLVIVARHIDLSVGSQVGFIGVLGALVQTGLAADRRRRTTWWIACLAMLAAGALIGLVQGMLIAYARIPSFVVTLGGLLFFRNAAYQLNDGKTVAPLDETFQLLGGGLHGTIGAFWSWVGRPPGGGRDRLGGGCHAAPAPPVRLRRADAAGRRRPRSSVWSAAALGFVAVMNAYKQPRAPAMPMGIAIPVLILIGVTVLMTDPGPQAPLRPPRLRDGRQPGERRARRHRHPAASRSTIFAVMGLLCGLASIVITARLNAGASVTGTMTELNVIAAAVIGGTSLAGGSARSTAPSSARSIMQSLESGMILMGVPTPLAEDGAGGRADPRGLGRHGLAPAAAAVSAGPAAPLVEMRGISKTFGGVHAVERRQRRSGGRRGAGAARPQRRRQVDADQDPLRRARRRRGRDPPRRARRSRSARRATRRRSGSRRSTRAWRSPTISTPPPICSSAASSTGRLGFMHEEAMEHAARGTLGRMRLQLPSLQAAVSSLSGGQRQAVAIARAIHFNARVLIMDEPTAALGPEETPQGRRADPRARPPGHRHHPDQPRHPRRVRPRRPADGDEERPPRRHLPHRRRSARTRCWP